MTLEDDDTLLTAALADVQRLHALERTALLDSPAERTFDRLTALVCRELGVPVSLVSLVTADRQFFKSQCGLPAPYGELRQTPLSHSFCQYVVAEQEAFVVTDAREDPRLHDNGAVLDMGVVSYAGFPLTTADGHVLGSFCAFDSRPRTWMAHELELLRDMAAMTMDVIELRAEAVAAAEAAGRFQSVLVPEPPSLERGAVWTAYRPGDLRLLLGGDFYVCHELPDGGVGLMIGDVVGHGPAAAAFAAGLRSAWQALQLTGQPLEQLTSTLNTVALTQGVAEDRYATALLGRITPDRREVTFATAGHPPPMLLLDGGVEMPAVPAGPPLGVLDAARWPPTRVALPPGAELLLYTDGLIEAPLPGSHERLGMERAIAEVARLRAGGASGERLLTDLVRLAERESLADDLALLLVRPD